MSRPDLGRLAAELLAAVLEEIGTVVLRATDKAADRLRNPERLEESPYVTAARWTPPPRPPVAPEAPEGLAVPHSSPCPVDGCAGSLNHTGDHLDDAGELVALEITLNLPTFMDDIAEAVRCQSVGGSLDDLASLQCEQAAGHNGRHTAGAYSWGLNLTPAEVKAGHPAVAVRERLAGLLEPEPEHVAEVQAHDQTGVECPVCFRRRHTADQAAECAAVAEAIESGALQ